MNRGICVTVMVVVCLGCFSVGWAQQSEITIDGRRLSSSAGGDDDGSDLITIGGIGDDPTNPLDPLEDERTSPDDELYDLALGNAIDPTPYVSDGILSLNVTTLNPSGDDNVFFAGLNVVVGALCTASADAAPALVCGSDAVTLDATGSVVTLDEERKGF